MQTTPSTSQLQAAADKAARGLRDSADMRSAAEEQDRAREALQRNLGVVNVVVDFVREVRES